MRILISLGRRAGLPALMTLALAGCYIPGGGWTMRTGADLRTKWKPSVFFEMVDTRWDEYNRIACQNQHSQCSTSHGNRGANGANGANGGNGAAGANGSGYATESGHSGCIFGFPVPSSIVPVPSNGPTLAPSYAPGTGTYPNPTGMGAPANSVPLNSVPQSPLPQYPPTPYPIPPSPEPQPYQNRAPENGPAEEAPAGTPRNEPSPAPGVTAYGQPSSPPTMGAWQAGSGGGPALMLPAPDPVVPAYGDLGGPNPGAAPASATNADDGLELSGYEPAPTTEKVPPFTAGSKLNAGRSSNRSAWRRQAAGDPTTPSGTNRHFSRPRM